MMKAAPTTPLVVAKSEFLLEVLVVPLDPPAQFGDSNQGTTADGRGQGGQKVFRWFGFVRRPLDQAPFLGTGRGTVVIAMRRADTHRGEARGEIGVGPSRQVTCRHAFLGSPSASCLAEIG